MKNSSLLAFILLFSLPASAQQRSFGAPPTPEEQAQMVELRKVQQAALASDYGYERLAYLCNNIGPRLSGSAQANQAAKYVADELRKLGLDVRLEKVMVPHWVRGVETAEITHWPGMLPNTTQKIVLTALGMSVATPAEGTTAEIVVAKDLEHLRAMKPEQVKGKIVVFTTSYDQAMAHAGHAFEAYGFAVVVRAAGASEAAKLGAIATVIRSVGGANYRLPHTGSLIYSADAPKIPAAAASSEDIDRLAALAAQGPVRIHLTLTPQSLPDVESYNVVADLKGSEHPEQIVIVSGHLDSWDLGTGAIDDGAGVAAAMQVAHAMQQAHMRPKRTLRVIAWMNEENGGKGEDFYVKDHAAEIANHVGAIEMDSGAGHALGIVAHVPEKELPSFSIVSRVLESQGAGIVQYSPRAPGADINSLDEKGVSSFAPLNDGRDYFNYHHTPADTFDKVDPKNLRENASVMAVLSWFLANR